MRVKVIVKAVIDDKPGIEQQLNNWFKENPSIDVFDIKIKSQYISGTMSGVMVYIFYNETNKSTYLKGDNSNV